MKTLVDEHRNPGQYTVVWDGKNDKGNYCAAGVYVILYKAKEKKELEKIILIR